jgi:hypothetical protein
MSEKVKLHSAIAHAARLLIDAEVMDEHGLTKSEAGAILTLAIAETTGLELSEADENAMCELFDNTAINTSQLRQQLEAADILSKTPKGEKAPAKSLLAGLRKKDS